MKAFLALEDGTIFEGTGFGIEGEVIGEIVFNTGMTGYQEILTDPSYYGQVVMMTYPLVGNYGINLEELKSNIPQVKGVIVRELCSSPSNWRSDGTLHNYLEKNNIIGIEGIDTRALTTIIRDKGTMNCIISTYQNFNFNKKLEEVKSYDIKNPVKEVTAKEIKHYDGSGYRVALIDYGVRQDIIRSLLNRNIEVYVFPASVSENEVLAVNPDGIILSNGPGNPKDCADEIRTIKAIMGKVPILGISLGHQLLALANGADTEKLKYGHRGINQPVKDIEMDLTYITSQNHGYIVIEDSVDEKRMLISHKNMNDGTIEGIRYKDIPAFSVQFYPETMFCPIGALNIYDEFIEKMKNWK